MAKLNIDDNDIKISSDTIGIDMGQSLTKIAYFDKNELNLLFLPTKTGIIELKDLLNSKKNTYSKFNFTGGKSFKLYKEYSEICKVGLYNEFQANVKGIEYLYFLEKHEKLLSSLIVTLGTGTSIILKEESFNHLGGSAMGGGFFMGMIKLVLDLNDFQEALELARKGDRYNVDLKVSDIYDPEDKRVDLLFREFTAASFGKIDQFFDTSSLKKEDFINSLICVIGENLGTIATLMAENNNIADIVFSGGFLKENRLLRRILSLICKVNKKRSIFLKNSEYSAAIGALIL